MCSECNCKPKKCINCGSKEHLEEFENPWNNYENITLCQKCAGTPFGEYQNKEFMKPWYE